MDDYTNETFNSIREDVNTFAHLLCRARDTLEAAASDMESYDTEVSDEMRDLISDIDDALTDWNE